MVNFDFFSNALVEVLKDTLPDGYVLRVEKIYKNNAILTGLVISRPDEKVSPVVYAEDFFRDYEKGESIDEIAAKILHFRMKEAVNGDMFLKELGLTDFTFENVKSRIKPRLVNIKANSARLANCPHRVFADDLAITYVVEVMNAAGTTGVVNINNTNMEALKVTEDVLYETALINSNDIVVRNILGMMDDIANGASSDNHDNDKEFAYAMKNDMPAVMTNSRKSLGTAALIHKNYLKSLCQSAGIKGFYIIPSSIHEVLLQKADSVNPLDARALNNMVREVNESELKTEEILSDHIYYFNGKDIISLHC